MSATTAATVASASVADRAAGAEPCARVAEARAGGGARQERWLAWRLDPPDAPPRVDAWLVSLGADVRRDAVAEAVTNLVARREELRSCFPHASSGLPAAGTPARLVDRGGPADGRGWIDWLVTAARETLDVASGPLAGVWWVQQGAATHLVIAMHELAGGAAGARAVLHELAAACSSDPHDSRTHWLREPRWAEDAATTDEAGRVIRRGMPSEPAFEPMDLPLDRSRPRLPGLGAHIAQAGIAADVNDRIRCQAEMMGVGVEDVWLAAVLAWLHRLSGNDTPWLGCSEGGPGAGWLPLAVERVAARPFSELVMDVARTRAGWDGRNGIGMPGPAAGVHARRDPGRYWDFDVTVEFGPLRLELRFGERLCAARRLSRTHLEGDLALTIDVTSPERLIEFRGNRDVFAERTLQRWAGHLRVLIDAALRSPETEVARLDLLTSGERELLVRGWNPAPVPRCTQERCLHHLLAEVARERVDHAAVVSDETVLTYRSLESRSNRLAHALIAEGVRPRDRVGLALPRSAEFAEASLAVLKAGAAFVPIDLEWPKDRREFVLRDCAAALVLDRGGAASSRAEPEDVRRVDVAALAAAAAACPEEMPALDVRPDDLAYVIYTSGTTGRPKGVMIDHRALSAHLLSIVQVYDLQPDDRGLLFHSVAFDPAIEQLFSPLVVGATVRVRGDGLWTGREFSEFVRREGITAVTLPPRYWLEIMREWERDPSLSLAGQLRRVLVGGEALPAAVVELWRRLGITSIRLLNGYGPTECTVTATVHVVPRERSVGEDCGRVPIGRPHGPVEAYVLDAQMQPQPVGVAGELCLAGPTLARGYLGAEALTRERFVPHPFRRGDHLYRTGDRARRLADGAIDFCGRTDRQVKAGGYRIEPDEIEAVLSSFDGIEACAVVADTGAGRETTLCAYVVAAPGMEPQIGAWRERARAALPRYMVPAEILLVPSLPRTINGKLDTKALARLGAESRAAAAPRRGARAPAEIEGETAARIATSWCDVLGRKDVAPEDDFFESGGHSLLAIALYAQLEKDCGSRFALREWLGDPTFGALVRLVESSILSPASADHGGQGGWKFLFPIRATGSRPRLFLFAGGRGCDEDFVVLAGLTRELGPDQPVWGIRVGGPDRLQPWHDDAWEMAEEIAGELRAFQPDGPYLLVGECVGGLLAYEVARVLERGGAEVGFLALINTVCPRPGESLRWWLRTTWVGRLRQEIPRLVGAWTTGGWRGVLEAGGPAWSRIASAPPPRRPRRADGMPDDPKDYFYGRMLLRYRPTPARLPLALVACETYLRGRDARRWSGFGLRGFAVVPVPGDTYSCLREHAAPTAIALRRVLPVSQGS